MTNDKESVYERLTKVAIEDVLPVIGEAYDSRKTKGRVDVAGVLVKVVSTRLRTFYKTGTYCHHCGLQASFFAIERTVNHKGTDHPYHLNLWGVDAEGQEVLFTHDHIIARALGGTDVVEENTQTSCGPCNWAKGEVEGVLALTDPIAVARRESRTREEQERHEARAQRKHDKRQAKLLAKPAGEAE
jgi:hypothetical protein